MMQRVGGGGWAVSGGGATHLDMREPPAHPVQRLKLCEHSSREVRLAVRALLQARL